MTAVQWLVEAGDWMPSTGLILSAGVQAQTFTLGQLRSGRTFSIDEPVVVYGSMDATQILAKHPTTRAWLFDDLPALRCTSYYRHVYPQLGRKTFFLPWEALKVLDLRAMLGDRVFVRPDTNDKAFPARVIASVDLPDLVRRYPHHRDEIVVVSEVVELGTEYRCFAREGKVFAHSNYPNEPFTQASDNVIAFAENVAARLMETLDVRMLSVDVANNVGHLRLVEVGGVNSWGLYGADVAAFIRAMELEARTVQF